MPILFPYPGVPTDEIEMRIKEKIVEETRGSDGLFSQINLTNLQNFDSIELEFMVRTDNAATDDDLEINLNGDTNSANYRQLYIGVDNVPSLVLSNSDSTDTADVAGDSATAGSFTYIRVIISAYAETDKFTIIDTYTGDREMNDLRWRRQAWTNTAAVTTIDYNIENGTNYKQGSRLFAYGHRTVTMAVK